jgi:hypothetical protein
VVRAVDLNTEFISTKYSISNNISLQHIQSAAIIQHKIFSKEEYSRGHCSTKYLFSRDIPGQNIQLGRIFPWTLQYKISIQQEIFQVVIYSVSKNIPLQYIQSAAILQYKIFSEQAYSSTAYSVSRGIAVQNIQSARIFQYKIFN